VLLTLAVLTPMLFVILNRSRGGQSPISVQEVT
jgi:hypothetical protein